MLKKNKITIAIGLATLVTMTNANAAIIDLEIVGAVDADAPPVQTDDAATSSTEVDLGVTASGVDSFASARARAIDTGWFYLTSSAFGSDATGTGSIAQNFTITNDGGDAFFDFDFTVENGSLSVFCDDGYGYGVESLDSPSIIDDIPGCSSGSGTAAYTAEIFVDNSLVWSSYASLELLNDNIELITDNSTVVLGSYNGGNFYSWGEQSFNIDLGLITANSMMEVSYVVTSTAISELADSYAQFNDPFSFNQTPIVISSTPANNVNTPNTLGILALTVFGFSAYRRIKLS